jgi:hypothetical protein
MDMKPDAVNKALMLAGNMPLTPKDKQYNNLPYKYARELYLPLLFNCLSEIEWRTARKWFPISLSRRYSMKEAGMWYYEIPSECIKPVKVEHGHFRQDERFIICEMENRRLWGVFHKRNPGWLAGRNTDGWTAGIPETQMERDRSIYIERPADPAARRDPRNMLRRPETKAEEEEAEGITEAQAQAQGAGEDFPEWEYTEYEPQFWKYFEYRLAAELSMKLKGDPNLYAQLVMLADKFGEEAIQSSRDSSEDQSIALTWLDKVGLHTSWDAGHQLFRRPQGLKTGF